MNDEKMKKIMKKYTESLKEEKDISKFDEKKFEFIGDFLDAAKAKAHRVAIECLDDILTPELKIFIRNLCLNKLGYPDEPLFYKIFGDYPENGTKVSEEELAEKGIKLNDFYEYYEIWNFEGNYVEEKQIDGKKYLVLEELSDYSPEVASDIALKELRRSEHFQKFINHINNTDWGEKEKEEIIKNVNDLAEIKKPLIGEIK